MKRRRRKKHHYEETERKKEEKKTIVLDPHIAKNVHPQIIVYVCPGQPRILSPRLSESRLPRLDFYDCLDLGGRIPAVSCPGTPQAAQVLFKCTHGIKEFCALRCSRPLSFPPGSDFGEKRAQKIKESQGMGQKERDGNEGKEGRKTSPTHVKSSFLHCSYRVARLLLRVARDRLMTPKAWDPRRHSMGN